jgi:type IV pilus assembly protein PilE
MEQAIRRRAQRGMSLIELIVACSIVGILMAIALPSYRRYVIRAQRADAKQALLATASALERCFSRYNAYNNADCAAAAGLPQTLQSGLYVISGVIGAGTYTLTATPQGVQANDTECMNLRVDQVNNRTATGTQTALYCWGR